jgi:catechol 2,3-dioxygenase-like lactoylglutathione lyase family enzyme
MSFDPVVAGAVATTISPWLSVRGGARAVEFYKAVLGAKEVYRVEAPDGAVVSRLSADGAEFWVSDESPEHGNVSPEASKGTPVRMILTVSDPDFGVQTGDCGRREGSLSRERRAWMARWPRGRSLRASLGNWPRNRPISGHASTLPSRAEFLRCGKPLSKSPCRSSPPSKIRFKKQNNATPGLLVQFSAKIRKDILATRMKKA